MSEQVERREVAQIVTHILLTVEQRPRTVWAMRWLEERTPDEVVAALGITHRQYARLLERASTAINRELLAYLAGRLVPRPRGAVRAQWPARDRRAPPGGQCRRRPMWRSRLVGLVHCGRRDHAS